MTSVEFKSWINGVNNTLEALAGDDESPADLITTQLWDEIITKVNESNSPTPFHSQPRVIG